MKQLLTVLGTVFAVTIAMVYATAVAGLSIFPYLGLLDVMFLAAGLSVCSVVVLILCELASDLPFKLAERGLLLELVQGTIAGAAALRIVEAIQPAAIHLHGLLSYLAVGLANTVGIVVVGIWLKFMTRPKHFFPVTKK